MSRKAIEVTKFPEVLKAVSTSVTASGQSAPYVQTLAISAVPDDFVEQDVPHELLETTALKITDWKQAQLWIGISLRSLNISLWDIVH